MLKSFLTRLSILALVMVFAVSIAAAQEKQEVKAKDQKKSETKMDEHKGHDHKTDKDSKSKKEDAADLKPWNAVCPVMGDEVDATVQTVKYDGKDYGFCCPSCIKKFKKDPAKYSKNLSEDGKTFKKK